MTTLVHLVPPLCLHAIAVTFSSLASPRFGFTCLTTALHVFVPRNMFTQPQFVRVARGGQDYRMFACAHRLYQPPLSDLHWYKANCKRIFMHLTNYSINRKSKNFKKNRAATQDGVGRFCDARWDRMRLFVEVHRCARPNLTCALSIEDHKYSAFCN